MLFLLTGFCAAAQVDIPFRMSRGMILVDTTIEGTPGQFILDSGAGETVLAKRTAAELKLSLNGQERIRTVRGAENASRAGTIDIRLGSSQKSITFAPNPLVMDLARESRTLGARLDGLLGADFFEGRHIQIDFRKSCIRVSPTGKPGPHATRLPLFPSRGGIFVSLTADESRLPRVRLDTGCCRSLCWSPPGGSLPGFWSDGTTVKVDVNLGPLVMSRIPTDVYRRPLFAGEDGLLGTAFLSRFDSVWIDSVNQRITFESPGD